MSDTNRPQQSPDMIAGDRCASFLSLFLLLLVMLPSLSFANEAIRSRAAVAMDAATGKLLYARNPDLKCRPASTTKLVTALVVIEKAELNDWVTISRKAASVSPYKAGFRAGDRVRLEELLYAALLNSANDAAVALAEAVAGTEQRFALLMNEKAAAIGALDSHFVNASGLPAAGQYTTAADLAKIMNYAMGYPKLKEIMGTRMAEISTVAGRDYSFKNTNKLLWSDDTVLMGKTGYTRKAQHCFVGAVQREKDTIIVSLLGSPDRDSLWKWSHILIARGFDVMAEKEKPYIYLAGSADLKDPGKAKGKALKKKTKKSGKKVIAKKKVKKKKVMLATKSKTKKVIGSTKKKRSVKVASVGKSGG
jgi:serine-type D-Ala-D-Ala carboxypeptidase (penicillin-binding protein 5/6)